jgi:ABC-2 type transport system permease protein
MVRADPAAGLRAHASVREMIGQTRAMAWRSLKKMLRNPEQFSDVTIQPIMFTAMLGYIFGGAIAGNVDTYLALLVPGMLTMSALTACMATGVQLREDMDKGVFDRFRSLPMARVTILAGPMVADLLRWALAGAFTLATGIAMGYRPNPGGAAAALALTVFAGWSIAWVFTWVGSIARTAESVQGISMMIMFPLVFLSNAFVPTDTLPGWLQAFVKVNPVSHVAAALRDLANSFALTAEVGWAVIGCAAVVAIFIPLTIRTLGRKL